MSRETNGRWSLWERWLDDSVGLEILSLSFLNFLCDFHRSLGISAIAKPIVPRDNTTAAAPADNGSVGWSSVLNSHGRYLQIVSRGI